LKVLLINNHSIPPYINCYELKVLEVYEVECQKINFKGDLVYTIKGAYGWKLARRFHIVEN